MCSWCPLREPHTQGREGGTKGKHKSSLGERGTGMEGNTMLNERKEGRKILETEKEKELK